MEGAAPQMLAWELVVEAEALRKQGWTISAIARHLGVTRSTVRNYLSGEQTPGVRASSAPDRFADYLEYCRRAFGRPECAFRRRSGISRTDRRSRGSGGATKTREEDSHPAGVFRPSIRSRPHPCGATRAGISMTVSGEFD